MDNTLTIDSSGHMEASTSARFLSVGSVHRLPSEILLLIFSNLDWDGSEPSIPVGCDCPWYRYVRTRKALIRVCKRWRDIATPLLYSMVYLHRVGQLVALVRTLSDRQSGNRGISHSVEHLRCEYYVPSDWELIYKRSIVKILTLCNVRTLVYKVFFDDRDVWDVLRSLFLMDNFEKQFARLQELTIGENVLVRGPQLVTKLSSLQGLRKLRLEINHMKNESRGHADCDVFLPNLTTLSLDVASASAFRSTNIIANYWTLPELQHLTINLTWSWDHGTGHTSLEPLHTLCAAHGARLLSFYIDGRTSHEHFATNLARIYQLCPLLTHITYSFDTTPDLGLFSDAWHLQTLSETSLLRDAANMETVHASLRCVTFLSQVMSARLVGLSFEHHLAELAVRKIFPSIDTVVLLDPRLRGQTVDARSLPYIYAIRLDFWAGLFARQNIRFLNCDGYPIQLLNLDREADKRDEGPDEADRGDKEFEYVSDELSSLSASDSGSSDARSEASVTYGDSDEGEGSGSTEGPARPKGRQRKPGLTIASALETFESTLRGSPAKTTDISSDGDTLEIIEMSEDDQPS